MRGTIKSASVPFTPSEMRERVNLTVEETILVVREFPRARREVTSAIRQLGYVILHSASSSARVSSTRSMFEVKVIVHC